MGYCFKKSRMFVVMLFLSFFAIGAFAQDNYALNFNTENAENDSEYVALNLAGFWTNIYTIEAWVYLSINAGDMQTFFRSGSGDLHLDRMSNGAAAYAGWSTSGGSIANATWTHVAFTSDGTDGILYVDGTPVDTSAYNGEMLQATTLFGNYTNGSSALRWAGALDEIRIWDVVRTETEINDAKDIELNGDEANLVGYWNFNDGSGAVLTDHSSNGNNGTLVNMEDSDWVVGAPVSNGGGVDPSKSLYFSGTAGNNKVVAKGFISLVDTVYTQELWVKPDSFTAGWNETHIMQFRGNYHSQLFLQDLNATRDTAYVKTQDGNAVWSMPVVVGHWTHIAYVRDGVSDSAYIYVNGQLGSTVVLDHESSTAADSNLVLGLYEGYETGKSSYSGLMDEVRVWNRALTEAEIQANMNKELSGDEAGLVAYYDFNDQSGSTLDDKTANSLDGTLSNMDQNWNTEGFPGVPTDIKSYKELSPKSFTLRQNYPNPFNPTTKISFELSKQTQVNLVIYNVLGEKVVELVNENMSAGQHKVTFNASNLSSGVYIYRFTAGEFTATKKMMLIK